MHGLYPRCRNLPWPNRLQAAAVAASARVAELAQHREQLAGRLAALEQEVQER